MEKTCRASLYNRLDAAAVGKLWLLPNIFMGPLVTTVCNRRAGFAASSFEGSTEGPQNFASSHSDQAHSS